MTTLTAARAQMEVSLAFHMVFAALGIAMPLLAVLAEWRFLVTRQEHYRELSRQWGKVTALLFVVGAVSGTALSFELGLLWPKFMKFAGPIIGSAFTLEGYAFFLEAIFVGLYLYGWDRLSPKVHMLCGIVVAVTGCLSGVLVVGANAWMQTPTGFTGIKDGLALGVDPFAPFTNPSFFVLALHSTIACYLAVGIGVAGVYAYGILRGRTDAYHRSALRLSLGMGLVACLLQPLSGDTLAKRVAVTQPLKLAAMEAHFETKRGASLLVGGVPDVDKQTVSYGIHIPKALSFLATGDFDGEVKGLDAFPKSEHPNVLLLHICFQIMVLGGSAALGVALLYVLVSVIAARKKREVPRWIYLLVTLVSPLGFLALEAGWFVTEAGRQPWIVYGVMKTEDAVTTVDPGASVWLFGGLYVGLFVILVGMLLGIAKRRQEGRATQLPVPHPVAPQETAMWVEIVAGALLTCVAAYGVFGGADFGGGMWDLLAFGPRKDAQRLAITHAMGPVWEANHIWLIFVVVLFFSCFPGAFSVYFESLAPLLRWVLVGIILRGASFVFRKYARNAELSDRWSTRLGVVFGVSSALTPFLLGLTLGAVSTGKLAITGVLPFALGFAALSLSVYVAAVFLCVETQGPLREDFRRRALVTGTVVVAGAMFTWPLLASEAPTLFAGLKSARALPIVVLGTLAALASGAGLLFRRYTLARVSAAAQVGLIIVGWGAAQYPYVLPNLTLYEAAAPQATLRFVAWTLPFGFALLVPSLIFLFRVFAHAEQHER